MDRQAILSEINRLEAQKGREPHAAVYLNEQITKLCDKLRQPSYSPRKVV